MGACPQFRLVVVPRACDWKAALPETLTSDFGVEVFPLDVPRLPRAESAREDWRRQIRELSGRLQQLTGHVLTGQNLSNAIAVYRRASRASRALSAAMRQPNPPLWGGDLLLAFSAALLMPIGEWVAAAEALVDQVHERVARGQGIGERVRLLLAGSPCLFPHFALPTLAEECGGVIVADESCTGSRVFHDSVRIDEATVPDMTDAVADRYLLPSTCPLFADAEDRLLRLEVLVEDFRPAGAIYHVLKSCFVYDMQLAAAQQRLESLGVPVLRLETDYGEASEESLRTRLEAFIETIG
jgi:benzoyl-CoA reductase/2-hydroxyglutaryl-CoA dehydratase subunit BcrC/BadD/HgdB